MLSLCQRGYESLLAGELAGAGGRVREKGPGWVLAIWGVLLLLDGWDAYFRHDVTEDDILREMHKTQ